MEVEQEDPTDAEIIEEFKEHGFTQHEAEEALKSFKRGMEDVRAGRISKIKWSEL